MLKGIELKNFKLFKDTVIPLSRLTLLTGTSSSGKSSILEAIKFLWKLESGMKPDVTYQREIGLPADVKGIRGPNYSLPLLSCVGKDNIPNINLIDEPNYFFAIRGVEIPKELRRVGCTEKLGSNVLSYMKEMCDISTDDEITFDILSERGGYGDHRALSIVSVLLMAAKKQEGKETIVLLENPEVFLSPHGQTLMGELIAIVAESWVQVIVETHSEYILDGIRIAVKEEKLSPDNVMVNFFERLPEFEVEIKNPKIDQNGRIDFWPKGFFDQNMINKARLSENIYDQIDRVPYRKTIDSSKYDNFEEVFEKVLVDLQRNK